MKIINSVIQVACPLYARANFFTAEQRNTTKIKFCKEMIVVFLYVNFTVGKFVQVIFGLSSSHFYLVALLNSCVIVTRVSR